MGKRMWLVSIAALIRCPLCVCGRDVGVKQLSGQLGCVAPLRMNEVTICCFNVSVNDLPWIVSNQSANESV